MILRKSITKKFEDEDGKEYEEEFILTYSSNSVFIKNENDEKFVSALDPQDSTHMYVETDEKCESDTEEVS